MPFSIAFWLETALVAFWFNVLVLELATERDTVARILIVAFAYVPPKSNVKVLPEGEPPSVKIGSASELLPSILKTLPTTPVPEPAAVIETV